MKIHTFVSHKALAAVFLLGVALPAPAQTPAAAPRPATAASQAKPQAKPETKPETKQQQRIDDRRWNELADQADALLGKGDFSQAESVSRELVAEGLRVFGDNHANTAVSYTSLGTSLLRQGGAAPLVDELRRRTATLLAS